MSFVRQPDPSTSCAESPYVHKFGPPTSGFSSQRFASGTELLYHGPQPCNAEGYGPSGFNGAPAPAFQNSFYNPNGHFQSHFDAVTYSPATSNISQQNSQSLSENQTSDLEVEFDNEMRLKLQELEHALLDDGDEMFSDLSSSINDEGIDHMKNNNEWTNTIKNVLRPDSPKESSPESSLCGPDSSNHGEAREPKQLLFDCAEAISEYSIDEAQSIIAELRQKVAIQGAPSQRIAAYLVEGLAATIQSSGKGIYRALRCKEARTLYQLSAMQVLFEVCPCFRLGFMAANYAILEACKGEEVVHIIDFDINQGSQYITLIQSLRGNSNKPRLLRITGVDDPESVHRVGGLKVVGQRLEKLAEDCEVSFEFRAVGVEVGDVTPAMLDCRPGEALVVNFAFLLHHLPDESVSIVNERDRLLHMVKDLQPKLVTLVEQDANTNTTPFLTRFREVYDYYSALFDSLDATLPRESPDRMNVERQCLAREIVNILACEGSDRVERYEVAGKWRARMAMAGFVPSPFSSNVIDGVKSLLKSYCDKYNFEKVHEGLHFGWGDKTLVVSSAWQ